MKETTWRISGMHCPHCETAVLQAVRDMKGIKNPRADYRAGTLCALWDDAVLPEAALRDRIAEAGYTLAGQRQAMPVWKRMLSLLAILAALDLRIPLSEGDNIVEFTVGAPGVIPYTCWMGMLRGTITAVE